MNLLKKIGVWTAITQRRFLLIFIFITLNAVRYRNAILEPFANQLHDDELQNGFFQQDLEL